MNIYFSNDTYNFLLPGTFEDVKDVPLTNLATNLMDLFTLFKKRDFVWQLS